MKHTLDLEKHYSGFKFFTHRQKPGQALDDYVTEMRRLNNDCLLLELRGLLPKDMLIIDLNDKGFQEQLLRHSNLQWLTRCLRLALVNQCTAGKV